jgi:hypothetical protein
MATEVKRPCQAISVRYVHDVRTGEFLNIGVVLMSPGNDFVGAQFITHWARVTGAFPDAEPVHLRRIVRAIMHACDAWLAATSQQLQLTRVNDIETFLRTVIEFDGDASIRFSPIISGVTANPKGTLDELFYLYAGRHAEPEPRQSREDADVWRSFIVKLAKPEIVLHLRPHVLSVPHYSLSFEHSWMNGQWNATQPLSLDMLDPNRIREKATQWTGRLMTVRPSTLDTNVCLLVGMPPPETPRLVRIAADDALAILEDNLRGEAWVLTEDHEDELAEKMIADITAHTRATETQS